MRAGLCRVRRFEKVWNLPGYILTRAPDQVLLRLRKLFERDPTQPRYFQTIRDVGILFEPAPPSDDDVPALDETDGTEATPNS